MERKSGRTRDVRSGLSAAPTPGAAAKGGRAAAKARDAEYSALLVRYMDATVGPRHDQFAELVEISAARASLYRYGYKVPRPETKARFSGRVGLPIEWFEAMTADSLFLRGKSSKPAGSTPAALAEDLSRRLAGQLAPRFAALRSVAPAAPPPPPPSLERAAADRAEADRHWTEIEPLTAAERALAVPEIPRFHSWALVELLCGKSVEAAPVSPAEALALAKLAIRLARRVQASQGFRDRLMGYALLHSAAALKSLNDLPRAREARARGLRLFAAGRKEDPGLLDEAIAEGLASSS
ncbi:MAG: hypothetical protein ABJC13_14685 [Acidobacteriota bacterium]